MADSSVELFSRFRGGEAAAAWAIYERYAQRLAAVARGRLSLPLRARLDPEDVLQSAYRSFFRRAAAGDFAIERSGELWKLLAAITVRKTLSQVEHHRAARRTPGRETPGADAAQAEADCAAQDRDADAATLAAIDDELAHWLAGMDPVRRQVVQMRLADAPLAEISQATARCERTIRRWLADWEAELRARLT